MSRTDYLSRREFVAGAAAAATLQVALVDVAFGRPAPAFTFAIISDAHIQHLRGREFVRAWDDALVRAVAETSQLRPQPDFVVFGGDLAHLGTRAELEHGAAILARLACPVHMVVGEHDYYLDLGEHWSRLFGPHWYSFDHKDVHFVVLNSVLTDGHWLDRWSSASERMAEMAGLENPNGSPFMVGAEQRAWLARDLARVPRGTPIVVLSHSPLQRIQRDWNFWTEDAGQVQALLAPFERVTVFYGHVHQLQHARSGNISFHSVKATSWPWPDVRSCWRSQSLLPVLTLSEGHGYFASGGGCDDTQTGWQLIDVHSGRVVLRHALQAPGPPGGPARDFPAAHATSASRA